MNKKVQKGLVAAVAATMGASVVAPTAFAASQTQNVSLAAEYEAAYNATAKATASKDQKELTSARVLVDALYNRVKGTAEEYLATTLSSILDPVQHVKLVAFMDAMNKAEGSVKQADINAAKALIIDMPEVWRNSYSSAMDTIQNALIKKVVEATEKAKTTGLEADKVAAQALLDEVKTVTNNNGVADWAKSFQATIDAIVTATKVESVSAIGAKKIEVKFNKTIDTTKATIEVKKGTAKPNITSVTYNAEKNTAVIELATKLTKGDYTVNVTGLTTETLTKTVAAEDEKVAKVEVLSKDAPLVDAAGDNKVDDMQVPYQVLNQYNENITKATALTTSDNNRVKYDAVKGLVTVQGPFDLNLNKQYTFSLIHVESGTSTTATITAVSESKASAIEIKGLYNKDGKTLDEVTDLSKTAFYMLVEVKDQYGTLIENVDKINNELLISESNPLVINVTKGTNVPKVETIKVNGVDKTAIKLTGSVTAGDNIVTLISKFTGKNAQTTIKVEESVRADVVQLTKPELVVVGEDALIPVTVLDKDGNEIKDTKILNGARGINVSVGGASLVGEVFKIVDGQLVIEVPKANLTKGYISVLAVSKTTHKTATLTLEVKDAAKPVVIRGLKSTVSPIMLANKNLAKTDLEVEDQYGRVMKTVTLGADNTAAVGSYRIVVEDSATGTVITNNDKQYIYNTGNITLAKGATNGTEKVTFAIEEKTSTAWEKVQGSEQEIEFRVTDGTEYASYEVAEVGTIFDETAYEADYGLTDKDEAIYNKPLKVYGILDDGKKIELDSTKYTVVASGALNYTTTDINADYFNAKSDGSIYDEDKTETTKSVTVTINATGQKFTQTVTISKAAPTIKELKVVAQGDAAGVTTKDGFDELEETLTFNYNNHTVVANTLVDFAVVDSYGVVHVLETGLTNNYAPTVRLVAVPGVAHTINITNNNRYDLTLANLDENEYADITATVSGIEKKFRVSATYDVDASAAAATAAVVTAETTKTQVSVDAARTLVNALPAGTTKTALVGRLDVVQAGIDTAAAEAAATAAVVTAETTKTQANVDAARTLVDALSVGTVKTDLTGRLNVVQAELDVTVATEAVVTAETTKTQANVDAARALVNALPDGATKTALAGRLDVVQAELDVTAATAAVVTAETTKTQADKDAATLLVNALPDGQTKTDLLARIALIVVV